MRALGLFAASLLACGCALVPLYAEPLPPEAERITARTGDGWNIALVRYRPRGEANGLPLLLCHGISANGRNMDLDAEHSLARWFAAQGRDTFTVSLRGGGDSDHPAPREGRSYRYTIDTFATEDLPAAIGRISELTGSAKVDYIGHSMGGLVGYIYLARGGAAINAAVTLGSPARFALGEMNERVLREIGKSVARNIDTVDMPTIAHAVMPLHGYIKAPTDYLLYNPENVSRELWQRFIAVGLGTVSGGVLRQFGLWIREGAMLSADGALDYRALLGQVRTPVLVVAGKADRTAPSPAAKAGYDYLGGPKQFFVAGEENGFRHDYGHVDLIIGERADEELWPRLLSFLDEHTPASP